MTFGSLFSGIGGFDLGLERIGMTCVFQVEKDKDCNRVLARHWPNVERHMDVETFDRRSTAFRPELLCGGFPCQDVSLAGRRAGLAGDRSGLWDEFARIIGDFLPAWVLIENVPGLLSSGHGGDFLEIIKTLAWMGYGVGWRVLDAQWFGLAQRRKRVFIVGCFGDPRRAAEVLFERESLPWDTPPRRNEGKEIARCIATGSNGSRYDGESETFVARCLNAGRDGYNDGGDQTYIPVHESAVCFQTRIGRGQPKDTVDALVGSESGVHGDSKPHVAYVGGVRRVMPVECCRLQGFPDDWVDGLSDSAKYRTLGNAVAVPVIEWLGRRMLAVVGY